MKFIQGERVLHSAKPDWGIGQVLDDSFGDNIRVFFVGSGEKKLNLKYVNLIKIEGAEAAHPVLDNLKAVQKEKSVKYQSLPLLIEAFLKQFPDGFSGAEYHKNERDYKLKAHDLMLNILNETSFSNLLKEDNYNEICSRALRIVNSTNLIFPNEKMSLKDGLISEQNKKRFSENLFSLLFEKEDIEKHFEAFAGCLLDIKAGKWTTLTYFLFITFPEKHMFLKPTVTQDAAEICGFELYYRSDLNWKTYSKLLEFSDYLFKALIELNPRDMIDIQSFIWCAAKVNAGNY